MRIEKLIADKGLKKTYVAELLGISRNALWKKMTGRLKFTDKEISDLSVILNLDKEVVRNAVLIN